MKKIILVFLLFMTFIQAKCIDTSFSKINTKLDQKIAESKDFILTKGFNENYIFIIDMSIPSGKNRFFIYNIKGDSIEASSLVAHGFGSDVGTDKLIFSNKINSYATSLGRYEIGKSYIGKYGLAYRLYGLDSSNSNTYVRDVVLHSDKAVSNVERYPYSAGFKSAGCPTVSPQFLKILSNYINNSKKPILMWILD